jgi:hypothetical protein
MHRKHAIVSIDLNGPGLKYCLLHLSSESVYPLLVNYEYNFRIPYAKVLIDHTIAYISRDSNQLVIVTS